MWDQLEEQYASGAASHAFHHMHISGIHNLVAIGQACCQSVDRSATALPRLSAALYCAAYPRDIVRSRCRTLDRRERVRPHNTTVLGLVDRGLRPTFEQVLEQLQEMINRLAKENDPLLAQSVTLAA
jgi:hypothetical protein